jgi:peroxiredoxin Q/BCP
MQEFLLEKGDKEMRSSTKHRNRLLLVGLLLVGLLGATRVSSALEAGEKAPDFKLPGTTGLDISLSDFRGKTWVLVEFYGADFQPT